jgi:GNAT superfamily N-acetyltransferase
MGSTGGRTSNVNRDVTIRRIVVADAGRARALRLEMLADTPLAFITTVADMAAMSHADFTGRIARAAQGTQIAHFVAESGRRLVGQAVGIEHPTETATTMVVAVYITHDFRGGPTLGALVDAVAEWSRAHGRPRLELEVVTSNARAYRAYLKQGFVPIGEPVPHPTISVLREQLMTRPA